MTRQFFRMASVTLMALALGACASSFRSDVTSFHVATPATGAKVVLVPIDESRQDSLEYRQYASSIQGVLEQNGFVGAREDEPDYIIGFGIEVSDGREKIRSFGGAGFGGNIWWQRGYAWGGWWDPFFPGAGFGPGFGGGFGPGFAGGGVTSRTVYLAQLHVEIRERDGTMIFEANVESETRSRRLTELVPLLAEALFEDFPGANGVTRRVKIDLEGRKRP